jgi:uncharacterized membrane protein YgaE (UPF0421/DUF939 family)
MPSSGVAVISPAQPSPLLRAVRIATAAIVTLFVAEWLQLTHVNLAVWTTHMIMVNYDFTVFQRGIERLLGRILGVVAGWVLIAVVPDATGIRLALEAIMVTALFYLFFAKRLAYTFLNAGMYLIAIISIGEQDPAHVNVVGRELLMATLVGVAVADLMIWLTASERDLRIQVGQEPLLPIRFEWLNHSLMLMVSAFVALFLTQFIGLPTEQAIISVFVISVAPDIQTNLRKGQLRLLGAVLAIGWGVFTFVIVGHLPHLLTLMGVVFFGMLLAEYLALASTTYSYAGIQMGLVLPLLVVMPPNEFGSVNSVVLRIEGVAAALVATLLVGGLWPFYSAVPTPAVAQK